MQQQRRPVVLVTAAAVVLAIAVVAALVTWGYARNQSPAGSPLAVAVVFAAVLTAGGVGLVILAGRPEVGPARPGGRARLAGAGSGGDAGSAEATGSDGVDGTSARPSAEPEPAADPPTAEQPRTPAAHSPRTALDPLGRRYGRHARPEAGSDAEEPLPSEFHYPFPTDLAATLNDQLFTHRSSARD